MSETDKKDLTSGSTQALLFRLGGPMVLGIAAVMSMSLVDAYFVGQVGAAQLAAIGFTFPVILTLQSLSIGLGAGAASVVSRTYGDGSRDQICRVSTDSLFLGIFIVSVLTVTGYLTIEPVFSLLGADAETMHDVVAYMQVWYLGLPLLVVPQIANSILRAGGDSLYPSIIMVTAAIVNVALDPILILGLWGAPRLELVGAAWASVGVRAVTLILSLCIVIFREQLITLAWPGFKVLIDSWRQIIKVAVPAAFGSSISPIGIAIVTSILAGYSASVVAGFGVATRIEAFASIPMFALSAAIGPIAGQNWTSDNRDRVQRALVQSYLFCVLWSTVTAVGLWFISDWIAAQFTEDEAVKQQVSTYLKIVPISLVGYGIVTIASGCFNAIDKSDKSLVFYTVRSAVLYVPLSFLASSLAGAYWVYGAIAITNLLAGAVVAYLSIRWIATARCQEVPSASQVVHEALTYG